MPSNLHSVTLDADRCIGCTDCIKRCPTEAIRVRNSKAQIIDERCIDCGNCIRACKNHAKRATTDPLSKIHDYRYTVAIPAPTIYTQFKGVDDPNIILTGLKRLGFDDVFEVAKAAEIITSFTREQIQKTKFKKPIISSACPVIVKLIQMRFPSLIPNILPIISPKEAMARYAKKYLINQGMKAEDIGVFFISPCAAKVTDSRRPETIFKSCVDGVISMQDIYLKLLPIIKQIKEPEALLVSTIEGIKWCSSGGEGDATGLDNHIAVDGIDNVIKILELIEDDKLDVDFVECLACTNGCLGGPLTIEDSFVSKYRMDHIRKYMQHSPLKRNLDICNTAINLSWDYALKTKLVTKLDDDMGKALEKIERIEEIYETLPQIDCGSCGAPTCHALAEDIIMGSANVEDCVFMLRKKVRDMAEEMFDLAKKLPPSISKK